MDENLPTPNPSVLGIEKKVFNYPPAKKKNLKSPWSICNIYIGA